VGAAIALGPLAGLSESGLGVMMAVAGLLYLLTLIFD